MALLACRDIESNPGPRSRGMLPLALTLLVFLLSFFLELLTTGVGVRLSVEVQFCEAPVVL